MFEEILKGESPTAIFRRLIQADASVGNIRLGELLSEEFPNLTGEAEQLIWHWKGPGKSQGLSDGDLDALLRKLFAKAGYIQLD
jgi:hypothetical protein